MESIVISFSADTTQLKTTLDLLVKTGQVTEADAKAFLALGDASKKAVNDINKPIAQLNKELKDVQQTVAKGFILDTTNSVAKTANNFKTLRQQIREATADAIMLGQKFGDLSPQAVEAQKKVAKLKDEFGDTQKRIDALNPDAKFRALSQTVGLATGLFGGLTGAIQLFGGESKEAEEIARKFQGALNIATSLNALGDLGDTLKNVRAALGLTTIATTAQTVATEGMAVAAASDAVATEGAAVATKSFTAALLSNPITIVLAAVAALAATYLILSENTEDAADAQARYNALFEEREKKLGAAVSKVTEKYVNEVNYRAESEKQFAISSAKNTEELEKSLSKIDLQRAKSIIGFVNSQKKLGYELSSELQSQYKTSVDLINDNTIKELKAREDKKKKIDEATKRTREETEREEQAARDREVDRYIDAYNAEIKATQDFYKRIEQLKVANELDPEKKLELTKNLSLKELEDAYEKTDKGIEAQKALADGKLLIEQDYTDKWENLQIEQGNAAIEKDKKTTASFVKSEDEKRENLLKTLDLIRGYADEVVGIFNGIYQNRITELEQEKSVILSKDDEEINSLKNKFELGGLAKKKYEAQIKALEEKKAADQKRIDAQITEEKRKQAVATKAIALFDIAINTAVAVIKTLASGAGFFSSPLALLVAALGASQAAVVAAQPLPKFHKGRLAHGNQAEELAIIRKDETIFDPQQSKEYAPTFRAIYNRQIKPGVLNEYVNFKLKNFAQNQSSTIDTNKLAHDIAWALRDHKDIAVKNSDQIAEAIAKRLPQFDPRKQ